MLLMTRSFFGILLAASLVSSLSSQTVHPLRKRIPKADPEKYRHIIDGNDWHNPMLVVRKRQSIRILGSGPILC
jgi:hypothetical protein